MLRTIKQLVADNTFPTFAQFYKQYVMDMQDAMLDTEMDLLHRSSTFNIYTLLKLANVSTERW